MVSIPAELHLYYQLIAVFRCFQMARRIVQVFNNVSLLQCIVCDKDVQNGFYNFRDVYIFEIVGLSFTSLNSVSSFRFKL